MGSRLIFVIKSGRYGSFLGIGKFMQQKELAELLGISTAMVSRLVKRGMPTDTAKRAERWRKRHLEPGRIKGARFDPKQATMQTTPKPGPAAAVVPNMSVSDVEAAGIELDNALTAGDQARVEVMTEQVRNLLRQLPDDANPALPVRVWEVLTNEVLALFPPEEGGPLCADGSPIYAESMTAEESEEMLRFWRDVATGRWIVNPEWQASAP
jgi:hypothetical protein